MKTNNPLSIFMIVVATVIWGGAFVVVKDGLSYIPPLWQLSLRMIVASDVMLIVFFPRLRKISRREFREGIIIGIFFALALVFQNIGSVYVSAGKASFMTVSYVAFVPIIGMVFFKQKIHIIRLISIVLCFIGVGLLTLTEKFTVNCFDTILIICGFFYGCHIVAIDKINRDSDLVTIHLIQVVIATVISTVLALIFEPLSGIQFNNQSVSGLLYCGILEVCIGFLLQLKGQRGTGSFLAGILFSMECIYAGIFGIIFMGDSFTFKMALGCVLIFCSAIVEAVGSSIGERRLENGY